MAWSLRKKPGEKMALSKFLQKRDSVKEIYPGMPPATENGILSGVGKTKHKTMHKKGLIAMSCKPLIIVGRLEGQVNECHLFNRQDD